MGKKITTQPSDIPAEFLEKFGELTVKKWRVAEHDFAMYAWRCVF